MIGILNNYSYIAKVIHRQPIDKVFSGAIIKVLKTNILKI